MRRQKGNLANWHGFSGGQQAARRRRRAREMQICTSEIAAVNPPMGGICRGGHRSANLRNGVLPALPPGWVRKIAHPRPAGQRVNPPIGGFVARVGSGWSSSRKAQICAITRSVRCSSLACARVDLLLELPNSLDNGVPLRHFAEDHPSHGRVVPAQLGIHCR